MDIGPESPLGMICNALHLFLKSGLLNSWAMSAVGKSWLGRNSCVHGQITHSEIDDWCRSYARKHYVLFNLPGLKIALSTSLVYHRP